MNVPAAAMLEMILTSSSPFLPEIFLARGEMPSPRHCRLVKLHMSTAHHKVRFVTFKSTEVKMH